MGIIGIFFKFKVQLHSHLKPDANDEEYGISNRRN